MYNVLQSFDLENGGKPLKQVPLPHTYYTAIVTPDNKTVWVGGGGGDFIAFDAETLEKKGEVKLPGNGSMSNNSVRLFSTR
ncbi:quinohemoprotein amine dehydrogenase, beta subunit [compost metagenome]